jgi:hypothetical protein
VTGTCERFLTFCPCIDRNCVLSFNPFFFLWFHFSFSDLLEAMMVAETTKQTLMVTVTGEEVSNVV